MKKSRIAKLALMGASITALAATLTTSTYAWYISNKTASVDEITGATAGAGSDESILVSKTGEYGSFSSSISLTAPTAGLVPAYTANGTTFVGVGNASITATEIAASTTNNGGVYHYSFYILSVAGGTYDPTITITNTTTSYTAQPCYAASLVTLNNNNTATVGQAFNANALAAMSLSFKYTKSSVAYANNYTFTGATPSEVFVNKLGTDYTTTAYDVSDYIKTKNSVATPTPYATAGAYDYYTELNGTAQGHNEDSFGDTNDGVTANPLSTITLEANKPALMEYYLWLNGPSDVCFNACAAQNIKISFSYTEHQSA